MLKPNNIYKMLTYIHKDKKLFENTNTKYQENWGKEKVVTQNITKQRQKKNPPIKYYEKC